MKKHVIRFAHTYLSRGVNIHPFQHEISQRVRCTINNLLIIVSTVGKLWKEPRRSRCCRNCSYVVFVFLFMSDAQTFLAPFHLLQWGGEHGSFKGVERGVTTWICHRYWIWEDYEVLSGFSWCRIQWTTIGCWSVAKINGWIVGDKQFFIWQLSLKSFLQLTLPSALRISNVWMKW